MRCIESVCAHVPPAVCNCTNLVTRPVRMVSTIESWIRCRIQMVRNRMDIFFFFFFPSEIGIRTLQLPNRKKVISMYSLCSLFFFFFFSKDRFDGQNFDSRVIKREWNEVRSTRSMNIRFIFLCFAVPKKIYFEMKKYFEIRVCRGMRRIFFN